MMPKEIDIAGVYLPPLLIVGVSALVAAWITSWVLNRFRLWQFFSHPQVAFLAIVVLYTAVFDAFLMPV
jgi:cytochrome c oxidase assembly factor CtaG